MSNFTTNGLEDIFIAKFDLDGNFIWNKQIGGTQADFANNIKATQTVNDEIIVVGNFIRTLDVDPNATINNITANGLIDGSDIFILKLSNTGTFTWCKQIGGTSSDFAVDIALDSNHIYTKGRFNGTVDFDPGAGVNNLVAGFNADVFVSKLELSTGDYIWAKGFGGGNVDYGNSISVDNAGNVYTTGSFEGFGIDFDPNAGTFLMNSDGSYDIFISKLSSTGTLVWAKRIGGFDFDNANSLFFNEQDNNFIHNG